MGLWDRIKERLGEMDTVNMAFALIVIVLFAGSSIAATSTSYKALVQDEVAADAESGGGDLVEMDVPASDREERDASDRRDRDDDDDREGKGGEDRRGNGDRDDDDDEEEEEEDDDQ